jgi:hypothetical protein
MFQSGSLQISPPVIDTLEPTATVLIGTIVFHEALAESALRLSVQLAGACAAIVGIVLLDRAAASTSHGAPTSSLPPARPAGSAARSSRSRAVRSCT